MSNRRTFIKTSAASVAGLGLSTSLSATLLSPSGILGANDKITVALIGANNMGFYNLKDLLKQTNVVCKTLCDVDDSVLARKAEELVTLGYKKPALEKDYRKVLEDKDIDKVFNKCIPRYDIKLKRLAENVN